jgi:hypothetical protein
MGAASCSLPLLGAGHGRHLPAQPKRKGIWHCAAARGKPATLAVVRSLPALDPTLNQHSISQSHFYLPLGLLPPDKVRQHCLHWGSGCEGQVQHSLAVMPLLQQPALHMPGLLGELLGGFSNARRRSGQLCRCCQHMQWHYC